MDGACLVVLGHVERWRPHHGVVQEAVNVVEGKWVRQRFHVRITGRAQNGLKGDSSVGKVDSVGG